MGVHCPKKGIYRYWSVAKWSQQRGWTWYYHTVCSHTVLHGPKVGMLIPFAPMVSHGEPMIPSFTIHINPPSAFVAMAWSYHVLPKPKQCPVQPSLQTATDAFLVLKVHESSEPMHWAQHSTCEAPKLMPKRCREVPGCGFTFLTISFQRMKVNAINPHRLCVCIYRISDFHCANVFQDFRTFASVELWGLWDRSSW
jgi:hypothetical protein